MGIKQGCDKISLAVIDAFLVYLAEKRRLAPATTENYRSDLEIFAKWLSLELDPNPDECDFKAKLTQRVLGVNGETLLRFVQHNAELAERTKARRAACLRSFYKWACRSELCPDNPAAKLRIKHPDHAPRIWTVSETKEFLDRIKHPRDRAIFEVIYALGLRLDRALALQLSDYNRETRLLARRQLTERAAEALESYLRVREATDVDHALFLNKFGLRISSRSVRRRFDLHLEQLERSSYEASPQTLRSSRIAHLLAAGLTDSALRKILQLAPNFYLQSYKQRNTDKPVLDIPLAALERPTTSHESTAPSTVQTGPFGRERRMDPTGQPTTAA